MAKIVIVNLKSNQQKEDVPEYVDKISNAINSNIIFLPKAEYFSNYQEKGITIGSQNCDINGYLTPEDLKHKNINYCLVGHSYRRGKFQEDEDLINNKIKSLLQVGIIPILCIGETEDDLVTNKKYEVLEAQLHQDLLGISSTDLYKIIIAYEPIWSIGRGQALNKKDIEETIKFIKTRYQSPVIYGGSVDDTNIQDLIEINTLDGVIIGTAAKDVNKIIKIIKTIK